MELHTERAAGNSPRLWVSAGALLLAGVAAVAVMARTQEAPQGLASKVALFTTAHGKHHTIAKTLAVKKALFSAAHGKLHAAAKARAISLQMNDTDGGAGHEDGDGGGEEGWGDYFWHEEEAMMGMIGLGHDNATDAGAGWDMGNGSWGWDMGDMGNTTAEWGHWLWHEEEKIMDWTGFGKHKDDGHEEHDDEEHHEGEHKSEQEEDHHEEEHDEEEEAAEEEAAE